MKEQILAYLNDYPGSRKRYIASAVHIWLCDKRFLQAMRELENDGMIHSIYFSDPANMEYYDKWYLTEAGFAAIMNHA